MKTTAIICIFLCLGLNALANDCTKQAETMAKELSKKKGNQPGELSSQLGQPTEKEDGAYVVYIGARTGYNYFKIKFDKNCKSGQVIDSEYP